MGAGLFHLGGKWPSLDELDHIGSFLSGVFTPIALAWAARSFLLQRQQMETTFDAMERQLHLQGEANEHTRRQMEAESEERGRAQLIDDARTAPRIRISSGSELIGTPDVDQHLGRLI